MLDAVDASPSARRVIAYAKGLFNGHVVSAVALQEHEKPSRPARYGTGPILTAPSGPFSSHHPIEASDARREALAQGKAMRQEHREKQLGFLLPLSPTEKTQTDR